MQRDDERQEIDAVEEAVSEEKPKGAEEPEADVAEDRAEREAEDYEDRDQLTGDEPPPA